MSNLEVPQKRPARPQRSARRPNSASRTPSPAPSDLTPPSGSDGDPSESSESIEDTSNPPKNTFNVPLPSSYIPNRQSSLVRPEAQPPVPSRASSLTVQQQQEQERLRNRQSSQSQHSSSNKSTDKRSSSLWHTIQSLKRNTSHSQSQFSGVRKRNTLSLFNFPRKAFSSTNLRKPSMSSLPTSPATHFAVPQRFSSVAADNDQIPTINEHPMKDIHDDWEPIQAWLSTVEPLKEEDESMAERQPLSSNSSMLRAHQFPAESLGNFGNSETPRTNPEHYVIQDPSGYSPERRESKILGDSHEEENTEEREQLPSRGRARERASRRTSGGISIEKRHSSLLRSMKNTEELTESTEAVQPTQPLDHVEPQHPQPECKSIISVEEVQLPLHFNSGPQPRHQMSFESDQFSIPRKPIRVFNYGADDNQQPTPRNSFETSIAYSSTKASTHSHESGNVHRHTEDPREEEGVMRSVYDRSASFAQEERYLEQIEQDDVVEELGTPTGTSLKESEEVVELGTPLGTIDTEDEVSILQKAACSLHSHSHSHSNPPSAVQTPDTKDIELPIPPAREEQLYSLVHPLYSPRMAYASHTPHTPRSADQDERISLSSGDILSAEADKLYHTEVFSPHSLPPNDLHSHKFKSHSPYIKLEESDDNDLMTIEDSLQGFYIDSAIGQAH
ncbi:hypothetical protein E3P77_00818 [Wallemia ichthyophaga]|nr:hypothetical protein E3P77_00818 [Wallemia ichthyophaga]